MCNKIGNMKWMRALGSNSHTNKTSFYGDRYLVWKCLRNVMIISNCRYRGIIMDHEECPRRPQCHAILAPNGRFRRTGRERAREIWARIKVGENVVRNLTVIATAIKAGHLPESLGLFYRLINWRPAQIKFGTTRSVHPSSVLSVANHLIPTCVTRALNDLFGARWARWHNHHRNVVII